MSETIERGWVQVTNRVEKYGMPALYMKKPKKECPNCGKYQFQEYKKEKMEEKALFRPLGLKIWKTYKFYDDEFEDIHGECRNCDYRTEEIEE